MIVQDNMSLPQAMAAFECDKDVYGEEWKSYYIQFNTTVFTRVGIAICDLGGEALFDNVRLFDVSNALVPADAKGDVNGDGKVNNRDLGLLQQFLNDWDVSISEQAADLNKDGKVNNRDLGLLQTKLNE